jgi:carbonic anhydrase
MSGQTLRLERYRTYCAQVSFENRYPSIAVQLGHVTAAIHIPFGGVGVQRLVEVNTRDDIFPQYLGTPIELLLRYHCLGEPQPDSSGQPQMFIAMCIDHRKRLSIPNEFAYMLRTAGTRLLGNEFELSFAIAIGGVSTIALIGHTQCGMTRVLEQREQFIQGLVKRAGVTPEVARAHFDASAPGYAITSPVDSILHKAKVVQKHLPDVLVAPLLYRVEDDQLAQINDRPLTASASGTGRDLRASQLRSESGA